MSNACILLSMSSVMVHVSHACKNRDMAKERISLSLDLMAMFLLFLITFSLVTAAVVWAILENISGLDPSSDTISSVILGFSSVSVSVSAQDGIVALGKAHTLSAPSLSSLLKVALETVPIFVWLNTDRSRPWRVECRPLPFPTPLSFRRSAL